MKNVAYTPAEITAVVCTLNASATIRRCLVSLRESGVGAIVVVDGKSSDGTEEIAKIYADIVITDNGTGLGAARNLGIAETISPLVLIFGADNVATPNLIVDMVSTLTLKSCSGVGAITIAEGTDYLSVSMNLYRAARFKEGFSGTVGSPTLFEGEMIRNHPFDTRRRFSDDSELCDRWSKDFGATFYRCSSPVLEIGRTSLKEVWNRWGYYGTSDQEIYRAGKASGWTIGRRLSSILYPMRMDFFVPLRNIQIGRIPAVMPFISLITFRRYSSWARGALKSRNVSDNQKLNHNS